ncbi:hypothetical protein [[Mycoplasma] collis]|uniref:hypothetical protein n=1 Tax=[Mycoplasma] collis TaxID=2127 RepID=UPI0012EB2508|nr:hypothetical protein [[Mycoplasma] collis]
MFFLKNFSDRQISQVAPIVSKKINFLPQWALILIGILLIILGISIIALHPIAVRKRNLYKQNQIEQYRLDNRIPKTKIIKYEETGMFLPWSQVVKYSLPIILGLTFCIIGTAWIFGTTIIL